MKKITLIITLFFLFGCQGNDTANFDELEKQLKELQQQTIASEMEYASILTELEQLKLESIDEEEDYAKQQKIIEQQDVRYNTLLDRWEKQADRMDKILEAQEKQYKVK